MLADTQKRFKMDRFCQVQQLQATIEPMSIWINIETKRRFVYHGAYYNEEIRRWRVELSTVGCLIFSYQNFSEFHSKIKKGLFIQQRI